jgi:hypothetical protein
MNPKLKEKLELMVVGYGFLFLNIYATSVGRPVFAIGFAVVSFIFFIRALRIKE